jgi:hypothetical protein
MSGIGVEAGEAAILDNRYGAATRDTEAAISMNAADAAAIGRHAGSRLSSVYWIPHLRPFVLI